MELAGSLVGAAAGARLENAAAHGTAPQRKVHWNSLEKPDLEGQPLQPYAFVGRSPIGASCYRSVEKQPKLWRMLRSLAVAARLGDVPLDGGVFITIGAPQAHGHSLEKPGLEGSEKEGTRLLNPFGGSAVGGPECPPFFFRHHRRAEGPWALC